MNASDLPSAQMMAVLDTAGPAALDEARILGTLVHNLEGMAYRCLNDADWTMVFVSDGCLALTGYPASGLLPGGRVTWEDLIHPADRARVRQEIGDSLSTGRRFAVQCRIRTRQGEVRWVLDRGVAVVDEHGHPVIEGFIADVTEHVATVQALQEAERRYREIFEHASEGMFQSSREGRYLAANRALARIYGYDSPHELIVHLADIERSLYVDPSRRALFCSLMEAQGQVSDFQSEVYRRDGSRIWISENARAVRSPTGEFLCFEGTVQDITERREHQAELERQANHDQLTGLPNRNLLADRLQQAMSRADRSGGLLALVFIDVDNFKFINDALGHAVGDELLKELANRLARSVRASDTVARQGGDEFVLVLNDHAHLTSIISQLERLVEVLGKPVSLAGRSMQVGASVGVALYPQDGRDGEALLKNADAAMYAAKARGKNNFQFFTPELNLVASERMHLEAAMRTGLERHEFTVHFQPKVDGRRQVVGVEALARWRHPQLGPISPDRFIAIAEECGLILPLTETITRQACEAAARWPCGPGRPLSVAVNLSPKLFIDPQLPERVAAWVTQAGLPLDRVELEVTESVFLDDRQRALRILQGFKAHGMRLAMDDFGSGYSSLSYLRHFPLDTIKIDRSLVTDLETQDEVAEIARAVVVLGKNLRKTLVAEGVELPEQFEFLKAVGCDQYQGYLFSKPLPEAELLTLLAQTGGQL